MRMKLLQWNIWFEEDIKKVAKFIKAQKVDVICVQELSQNFPKNGNINTAEALGKWLGMNFVYKIGQREKIKNKIKWLGNGIYSRYPIQHSRAKYIQTPHGVSQRFPDYARQGRIYIEADINVHGQTYTVGTTHAAFERSMKDTPRKKKEIKKILDIVAKKKARYIFAGDLNAEPQSTLIKGVKRYLKHTGPDFRFVTYTTKPHLKTYKDHAPLQWRIDYVFATADIKIKRAKLVKTTVSDHLPIVVDFDI